MTTSIGTTPTTVEGVANDPHLPLSDGTRRRLRFFSDFESGQRVLDVGCGSGDHVKELAERGCEVVGVEPDSVSVRTLREQGFDVVQGTAECLPFDDASFDAIVCSVVVPYTDERRTIAEWSRVLAPQGQVRASYHGWGYALGFLLYGPGIRRRIYGSRTIVNSWVYRLTGQRLPGFWGDTSYQSATRLKRYYGEARLSLVAEYVRPTLGGLPDVFFHQLIKAE